MVSNPKWLFMPVYVLALAAGGRTSQEIMMQLTTGFAKGLHDCMTELGTPRTVMQELYKFWNEEFELVHRELGCVFVCLASKLDLITEDSKLHHGNAHEFARTHGADEETAKQLVSIIQDCEKKNSAIGDECDRMLNITRCFRQEIHRLQWAPDMETVLEEVMMQA